MNCKMLLGVVLSLLVISLPACNSCGPTVTDLVTIHYRQSANLQNFEIPGTQSPCTGYVTGSGLWALFEIESISNNDQKPVTFTMNFTDGSSSPLYVLYGGQNYYPGAGAASQCVETVSSTVVVPPGSTSTYVGRFFIDVATATSVDNNAQFQLLYKSPQGQPVVLARDDGIEPNPATYHGFTGQPPSKGLPIFENYPVVSEIMTLILHCTSQLTPPSDCIAE
ncbi:MAG: hypothetical protein ACLQBU_14770 [Terriglobales bacterium]